MWWWPTDDAEGEITGDMPADAAADLLAPMKAREPKPSLDELLDALEAALAAAAPRPYTGELGTRHLGSTKLPRTPGPANPELVELLAKGIAWIAEPYQTDFQRLPTIAEYVYTVAFALRPDHVRDRVDNLGWIRLRDS
jgi:hypothetical protein